MNYFKDELLRWCILIALTALGVMIFCVYNSGADEIDDIMPFLIQVESGGNPNAVSKAGAIGIAQITPVVLREFNENSSYPSSFLGSSITLGHLYKPEVNVYVATWYLRRLRSKYGCETLEQCLAGYNCGPTKLRSVDYDISKCPKETQAYVKKIMKAYRESKCAKTDAE